MLGLQLRSDNPNALLICFRPTTADHKCEASHDIYIYIHTYIANSIMLL